MQCRVRDDYSGSFHRVGARRIKDRKSNQTMTGMGGDDTSDLALHASHRTSSQRSFLEREMLKNDEHMQILRIGNFFARREYVRQCTLGQNGLQRGDAHLATCPFSVVHAAPHHRRSNGKMRK